MKLLNIFKSEKRSIEATNKVIDEIHETFYSEVERLLANSMITMSEDTKLNDLIEKSKRLKALGFTNTKECKEANVEITRLEEVKKLNKSQESLNEAINYFSLKYPLNRFITEDSVIKICNKYGLIYGPIGRYLGDVPDKNLKEIESINVKEEDCLLIETERSWSSRNDKYTNVSLSDYRFIHKKAIEESQRESNTGLYNHSNYHYRNRLRNISKSNLEICAPVKDFNMEGYEVKGVKLSKIEILDPVVLHPVMYDGKKYYLIVSAWGQESSDELVVNKINN